MKGSSNTQLENRFYELYIDFFNRAEAERRWNVQKDIPWDQCNSKASDAIALIVESFCAESKHSLVLEEWLVRSGKRSIQEVRDFAGTVLEREWELPFSTPRQMMIYTTFQELSTGLNYKNLRRKAMEQGDKALATALSFVARDESAHYQFFQDGVKLYMQEDRDGTLEDMKKVLEGFRMPAQDLIPNWEVRGKTIIGEKVFSDRIFYKDIMRPILSILGTSRDELQALGEKLPELTVPPSLAR